jgi:hypothetical protein
MIIVGKYEVIDEIDRGGMGIVYKVRHLELNAVFVLNKPISRLSFVHQSADLN